MHQQLLAFDETSEKTEATDVTAVVETKSLLTTALGNQRMVLANQKMSPVNHVTVMIARMAENVEEDVKDLTILPMRQKLPIFLDDSFEKPQSDLMTQRRNLATEPENLALTMIVDVRVARKAVNHEKAKMSPLRHQKRPNFPDVLLDKMDAKAERDLTQQFLTDSLILLASLEKLFLET